MVLITSVRVPFRVILLNVMTFKASSERYECSRSTIGIYDQRRNPVTFQDLPHHAEDSKRLYANHECGLVT